MAENGTVGILAYGAYLPRLRLARKSVADANAWFNPALKGLAKGERTMCNWDEDSRDHGRGGRARLPRRRRTAAPSPRFRLPPPASRSRTASTPASCWRR